MQIVKDTFNLRSPAVHDEVSKSASEWKWYHLLPIAAAAIYIFAPFLSLQFGLPSAIKFLGDAIVIVMIGLAIGTMLLTDRIPGMFVVIIALTLIGALVAVFEGQSSIVTFYGWWMMFRYVMVGLFVYMVRDWPKSIASLIPKVMTALLVLEVSVQILLYLTGTRDFDNLAGTFGIKGVGPFVYFILLVLAIALGKWLVYGEWNMLVITLALGSFASALGEMKLFIIAAPLMAVVALGIHLLRGAQPRKVILYLTFFAVAAAGFLYAYDIIVVQGLGKPPLETFLDSERRDRYFEFERGSGDLYRLGRNNEIEYGWQLIQRDEPTLLFGHGLGSRQYSPELGLIGAGLQSSVYGLYVGRSLFVLMYEMGIIGLTVMGFLMVITIVSLYRATKVDPDADMNVLRFALLIYTLFWPVWIWYKAIWIMPAPSIMYWMLWGYTMQSTIGYTFRQPATKFSRQSQNA